MSEDSLETPSSQVIQDIPMDLSLPSPNVTPVDFSSSSQFTETQAMDGTGQ